MVTKQQANKLVGLRAHFRLARWSIEQEYAVVVSMHEKVIECLGGRGKLQDSTQIKGVGAIWIDVARIHSLAQCG